LRIAAVLLVVMALVIGVAPQFTHCKTGSTMSGAGSTASASAATAAGPTAVATTRPEPMRCYWSARAAIGVALPLFVVGVLCFLSRRKETRRALAVLVSVLGVVTILVPTVLIGVCSTSSAECNTTMRPIMVAAGGLTVVIGLITLLRNELATERHVVAVQPAS
jgi:hypothetical protein